MKSICIPYAIGTNRAARKTERLIWFRKTDSLAEVGKEHKESRRTVAYLIRLTHLLPELLKLVDDGKIAFKVGVEMSYLAQETQEYILNTIIPSGGKIKAGQISDLRKIENMKR